MSNSLPEHPIRKQEIRVYSPMKKGHKFLAQIGNGGTWPILFRGDSALQVHKKAKEFIQNVIDKHEAAFIAGQERKAAAKARKSEGTAA